MTDPSPFELSKVAKKDILEDKFEEVHALLNELQMVVAAQSD